LSLLSPPSLRLVVPAILLVGLLAGTAPGSTAAPSKQAPSAKKAGPPVEVRIDLTLTRTDSGGDATQALPTDGKPVVLGTPVLTTLNGSTATLSITGTDLSYNVALSPVVEAANNTSNTGNSGGATGTKSAGGSSTGTNTAPAAAPVVPAGPGVQVQWNVRFSGKSLPGMTTCSISGASRVEIGKDAAMTEMTMTDPKTGRATTFRLVAKITVRDPSVPSPVPGTNGAGVSSQP
jgi:hypothetical protein